MTITKRSPRASSQERASFGAYDRDEVGHEVVAVRDPSGSWRLEDVTEEAVTLIEPFAADEELDAVQAVAELYLAEMRL